MGQNTKLLFCFPLFFFWKTIKQEFFDYCWKRTSVLNYLVKKIRKKSPNNGGQRWTKISAVTIQFCENKRIAKNPWILRCNKCLYWWSRKYCFGFRSGWWVFKCRKFGLWYCSIMLAGKKEKPIKERIIVHWSMLYHSRVTKSAVTKYITQPLD